MTKSNPSKQITPPNICNYRSPMGHTCKRNQYLDMNFCALHLQGRISTSETIFKQYIDEAISKKDGDWKGCNIPSHFTLPKEIDFSVDLRWCKFDSLNLESVAFYEECDFSDTEFNGELQLKRCKFHKKVEFKRCDFKDKVEFDSVEFHKFTSFSDAEFLERVLFRVRFMERVDFSNVIFKEAVTFSGWRNITIQLSGIASATGFMSAIVSQTNSKLTLLQRSRERIIAIWNSLKSVANKAKTWIQEYIKRIAIFFAEKGKKIKRRLIGNKEGVEDFLVFEKEVILTNVIFFKPAQVNFSSVNMTEARISGTNFRGARFLGVSWYQPKLKRNGLHEENWIRESGDATFMKKQFPQLEDSYRNIRATLEDNLSFSAASDFYIGEMEAQRSQLGIFKRHLFSVAAWYNFVSKYGTSVPRALTVLLVVIGVHILLTIIINYDFSSENYVFISEIFQRTFRLFAFQNIDMASYSIQDSVSQMWVDIGLKLLGLAQLTMLIFAFRSRIKRH